eukprot:TRINITY_DN34798_c0_g1_i1.p1 TRINITY_DN34798_c0_g1~~TRINITY_DN34798_c0_g1_i1.p1  ORF type:complete len:536 (+),score=101.98 TRINITY_DN34798_c0_g1_i1:203-1810(+)
MADEAPSKASSKLAAGVRVARTLERLRTQASMEMEVGAAAIASRRLMDALLRELELSMLQLGGKAPCYQCAGAHPVLVGLSAVSEFSLHVGFFSNAQIITNLLHMVVQLALFPRPCSSEQEVQCSVQTVSVAAQTVGRPAQGNAPVPASSPTRACTVPKAAVATPDVFSAPVTKKKAPQRPSSPQRQKRPGSAGTRPRAPVVQPAAAPTPAATPPPAVKQPPATVSTAPPVPAHHQEMRLGGEYDTLGVRIGGGYHIIPASTLGIGGQPPAHLGGHKRSRSPSPAPLGGSVEDMLEDHGSSLSALEAASRHAIAQYGHHPYAHGMPSSCTASERFSVGAYALGTAGTVITHDAHKDAERHHLAEKQGVQLYRVLKPERPHSMEREESPHDAVTHHQRARSPGPGLRGGSSYAQQVQRGNLYPSSFMKQEKEDVRPPCQQAEVRKDHEAVVHEAELYTYDRLRAPSPPVAQAYQAVQELILDARQHPVGSGSAAVAAVNGRPRRGSRPGSARSSRGAQGQPWAGPRPSSARSASRT